MGEETIRDLARQERFELERRRLRYTTRLAARPETWRARARPLVAEMLLATAGQDEKAVCRALREGYPWGERKRHPYKIWRSECRLQRGLFPTKKPPPPPPGQLPLPGLTESPPETITTAPDAPGAYSPPIQKVLAL